MKRFFANPIALALMMRTGASNRLHAAKPSLYHMLKLHCEII